jgi:hypothetical protein
MQIVKIKCIKHYWTEDLPFTHAQAIDPANVLHKMGDFKMTHEEY